MRLTLTLTLANMGRGDGTHAPGAQPRAAVVQLVDAAEAALERRVVDLPDPLPLPTGVPPHDIEAGRGAHVDEEVRAEEHEDVREVEAAPG